MSLAEPSAQQRPSPVLATNLRNFYLLGYGRNYPVGNSAAVFNPGIPHPVLGYRYLLSPDWVMSLGGQMKFFSFRQQKSQLVLLTLSHESAYQIRIYHPFYLLIGGKISYILPLRKGKLPFQRQPAFGNELGAAVRLALTYFFANDLFGEIYAERWRGTKTNTLHGLEAGLSMGFAF